MSLVADEFNISFVKVGLGLAKKIPKTGNKNNVEGKTIKVANSMFLKGTDEKEIIDIVNNCKAKTSIDNNGIDMALVKTKYYRTCGETSYIYL